jgi:hypothetical protein
MICIEDLGFNAIASPPPLQNAIASPHLPKRDRTPPSLKILFFPTKSPKAAIKCLSPTIRNERSAFGVEVRCDRSSDLVRVSILEVLIRFTSFASSKPNRLPSEASESNVLLNSKLME